MTTLYLNIHSGSGGTTTSANRTWNDVSGGGTIGDKRTNLLDKDGNATVFDLEVIDAFANGSGTGGSTTTGSGDAAWIDEGAISEQYWNTSEAGDNLGGIRIKDMAAENGNTWYVEIFGHRDSAAATSRLTGVGGTTAANDDSFDAKENTTLVGSFSAVVASGNLDIYVRATESGGFGYVNAIRISDDVNFDETQGSILPLLNAYHG